MTRTELDQPATAALIQGVSAEDWGRLLAGELADPHRLLGAHAVAIDGQDGAVIRAMHPDAVAATAILADRQEVPLRLTDYPGLFAAFISDATWPMVYRVRFQFSDGATWERDDPYRFLPTIGDLDLFLFNEGTHRKLWEALGARVIRHQGVEGTAFAVWAPNARRVSVVGDFCHWDGRLLPMRQLGASGVYELFVPGVGPEAIYKFEIRTREGGLRLKTDPLAGAMEPPPHAASRVARTTYRWGDDEWMRARKRRDITREPMAAYEVHLGSWRRVPDDHHRSLTYREIAPLLIEHVKRYGFTHVELMPVAEYPFGGSWGYQVTGYFAPTSRYGRPDDLRYFIDQCHQNGIGVILDWVPAHFPRDDFALRRFDGTALYEHEDPRRGEHPDWGTLIFNYGRNEVRSFLISNALYWLDRYHVDGLRVDAVASMLYLDYSRQGGEWLPNQWGGKENVEAIELLRAVNHAVREEYPGCFTIAEESTGWTGVTRPVTEGGLGFTFKWNMGWMHDTLLYFSKEPVHRKYHQNDLTFAMLYEHSERFINPLSHDEVVHGKRSLLEKMPGDMWQKFANLRALFAYQYTRPGKKMLFMGSEIAPYAEWYYEVSLDWHLLSDPTRAGLSHMLQELGRLYHAHPCLWRTDPDHATFAWIDCQDHEQSVLSYFRRDGEKHLVVVLNLTPVPRDGYRIGAPRAGRYRIALNTDATEFGGSGYPCPTTIETNPVAAHGHPQSLELRLPPLSAIVLEPVF